MDLVPDTDAYRIMDRIHGNSALDYSEHDIPNPGYLNRTLSFPGAMLDRFVVKVMERMFLSVDEVDLERELETLIDSLYEEYDPEVLFEEPERFFRPPDEPEEFRVRQLDEFDRGEHLRLTFESTYEPYNDSYADKYLGYDSNHIVRSRIWRHYDRSCPTIFCLHYWCGGFLGFDEYIFDAARWYRHGFNVVLMTLPFHGGRTPGGPYRSGQFFPSQNPRRTNEAFGQAVADVRTLMNWMEKEGFEGSTGMMGISLGGYIAALMACLTDEIDFSVPIVAPVSIPDLMWKLGEDHPRRKKAEKYGLDLELLRMASGVHCPLNFELKIPREDVLIVAATGDRIVHPHHPMALWYHWDKPDLKWFTGGHILQLGRFDYIGSIENWIQRHL